MPVVMDGYLPGQEQAIQEANQDMIFYGLGRAVATIHSDGRKEEGLFAVFGRAAGTSKWAKEGYIAISESGLRRNFTLMADGGFWSHGDFKLANESTRMYVHKAFLALDTADEQLRSGRPVSSFPTVDSVGEAAAAAYLYLRGSRSPS